jgi:hypothetical protein
MLKCRDIASEASNYLDEKLSFRQRIAFAFHLLICGKCRAFISQLRTAIMYYNRLTAEALEDQEADEIVARVTSRKN